MELQAAGVDVTDLDPGRWWAQLAWLLQSVPRRDPLGTIAENLTLFGELRRPRNRLRGQARCCMAGLPDGVHTRIGRDGVGLSLGQRQRLGPAAAPVHLAPVLSMNPLPTWMLPPPSPACWVRAHRPCLALRHRRRDRSSSVGARRRRPHQRGGSAHAWKLRRGAAAIVAPDVLPTAGHPCLGIVSRAVRLALAAVSAWLITRAWQMPPVLDLSIAAVAVRRWRSPAGHALRNARSRHRPTGSIERARVRSTAGSRTN